jgi:hypothetical protein
MARGVQNLTNIVAPGGDYPFGRIKDNTGDNSGTPFNEKAYGDLHQTLAKILAQAGIAPNGLPDNVTNGYQYIQALNIVYGFHRTILTKSGAPVSDVVNGDEMPIVVVLPGAAAGHVISINSPAAGYSGKLTVINLSANSINVQGPGLETFNGLAAPYAVPSNVAVELDCNVAATPDNWVVSLKWKLV